MFARMAVGAAVLALVLPAAASARAYVLKPTSYGSSGDLISGWNWLRSTEDTATWTFDAAALQSARPSSVYLNVAPLVTNGVNGGSGYSTTIALSITGTVTRTVRASLFNPFRPRDAAFSSGLGYQTYGSAYLSSSIWRRATTITVTATYPTSRYHVAVNRDAMSIGYSLG